jgi:hypothetical protein
MSLVFLDGLIACWKHHFRTNGGFWEGLFESWWRWRNGGVWRILDYIYVSFVTYAPKLWTVKSLVSGASHECTAFSSRVCVGGFFSFVAKVPIYYTSDSKSTDSVRDSCHRHTFIHELLWIKIHIFFIEMRTPIETIAWIAIKVTTSFHIKASSNILLKNHWGNHPLQNIWNIRDKGH